MTVNLKESNLSLSDGWRTESNIEQWKPLAPISLCWLKPALRQPNHPFTYTLLQLVIFNWSFSPAVLLQQIVLYMSIKRLVNTWRICLFLTRKFTKYNIICDTDRHHHSCLALISPRVKWHTRKYREIYGRRHHQHNTERQILEKQTSTRISFKNRKTMKTESQKNAPSLTCFSFTVQPGREWHTSSTPDLTGSLRITENKRANEQIIPDWMYRIMQ